MVPDEPDLLRHVTQLDVRDNRLMELDASVFPRLEILHCERNNITCLKVRGSVLKGIYASNNGGCDPALSFPSSTTTSPVSQPYLHLCSISVFYPIDLSFQMPVSCSSVLMPLIFSSIQPSNCPSPSFPFTPSPVLSSVLRLPPFLLGCPCCRLMCLNFSLQNYDIWMSVLCPPILVTWISRGKERNIYL